MSSTNQPEKRFSSFKELIQNKSVFYPPLIALIIVGALIFYLFSFNGRVYPGVKVAGIEISGKTPQESEQIVLQRLQEKRSLGLTFSDGKKVSLEELSLTFDIPTTIQKAFNWGRNPYPLENLKEHFSSWFDSINLPIEIHTGDKFDEFIAKIAKEKDQPSVDASVTLEKGEVVIKSAKDGLIVDQELLKRGILTSLGYLEEKQITVVQKLDIPKVTNEGAQKAKEETKKILSQNLSINFNELAWILKPEDIIKLISFEPSEGELEVNLNKEEITKFVEKIAREVNQEAVNARFDYSEGKVLAFVPEREGREVSIQEASTKIQTAIKESSKSVDLPVKVTKPAVTAGAINDLGIKELLGRGESRFVGSGEGRIFNLALSSEKLHGVLVPPGETFSMYKTIGDVEASTGYREAYIILDGKTQVGVGGGVCQVSTTLFRAALNAGLPITERYPHAYRVSYYEQNSPAGVDASVYFPTSDFKFKNDTSGHILIQRKLDLRSQTIVFEFYGTSDGRKVTVGKPRVYNLIKPKAPLYQPDAALNKGITKQIDFEAWGADAYFERTVTKNGDAKTDKFFTRYQPWQAIFLVGTRE